MSDAPNNPQAFPTHDANPGTDPRSQVLTGGMTLRDYFAGQALAGLCANADAMFGGHYQGDPDAITMIAVRFADAMLAARGDA